MTTKKKNRAYYEKHKEDIKEKYRKRYMSMSKEERRQYFKKYYQKSKLLKSINNSYLIAKKEIDTDQKNKVMDEMIKNFINKKNFGEIIIKRNHKV